MRVRVRRARANKNIITNLTYAHARKPNPTGLGERARLSYLH